MQFATIAAGAVVLSVVSFAADPWIGSWMYKPTKSTRERRTEIRFEARDGGFKMTSNAAPEMEFRFGTDNTTKGRTYDRTSFERIDDHSFRTVQSLAGKPTRIKTSTVSPDGKTLVVRSEYTAASNAKPDPAKIAVAFSRIGPPAADGNPFVGAWQENDVNTETLPQSGMELAQLPDGKLRVISGYWFDAAIDGKFYPVHGPSRDDEVALERLLRAQETMTPSVLERNQQ